MSQRTVAATEPTKCPAQRRPGCGGPSVRAVVLAAIGIVLVLNTPPALQAQANNGWVGKRVVPRYRGFQLRVENQVIDTKTWIGIYRVEQVNGPWLWVHATGLSGWAPADQVVPVEQAIEFFTDYIRANPGDAFGYTMRAIIWREERKELDIAIGDYNEAIRLAPTNGSVYCNRGLAWADKKEYDKAIADYNEAIRLDYKCAIPYNNRGLAWADKKEYDKAIADYNEAIRLDYKYADAYFNRGGARRNKMEYDKAITDYGQAIRLAPKDAEPYFGRAVVLFSSAHPGDAVQDLKTVLDLERWRGRVSVYAVILGHFAALRQNQSDQAKSFLNGAVARCDKSAWPYPVVEYIRGEIDQVKLLAAATDDDKRTEARCYLSLDSIQKNQKEVALAHLRWVKEHGNPNFYEFTLALAEMERLIGK